MNARLLNIAPPFMGKTVADRLTERSDRSGGQNACWQWVGSSRSRAKNKQYGSISIAGRDYPAHRVAMIEHLGGVPIDLQVLHVCDNQRCVNPDHLWLGTQDDNMADMVAKGRCPTPTGEANHWAKLTEERAASILADTRRHATIAAEHGVSVSTVRMIKCRYYWRHLPDPRVANVHANAEGP